MDHSRRAGPFAGKAAIVTGGASGIGAALVKALADRGARVVAADRDGARAEALARGIGSERVRAAALDVTDAAAVQALVDEVVDREGRLDLLFNNAGVGLGGEVRDMGLEDWRRLIDVNIWGVIHGIHAAYPVMLSQGAGHIVNTASGAGLAPRPGMTAYAMSKHAVVGLSTSLRSEAAELGVRVTVVCPGYIQTNIMASTAFVNVDGAKMAEGIPIKPMSAEDCAERILRGVEKNRGIVVVGAYPWLDWALFRLSPDLAMWAARWRARRFRAHRTKP